MNYSVLMAVYHKDNPQYFDESIKSILDQTVKTNDFIIVCDGPLTDELNEVLEKYSNIEYLNIHRLENNVGLGRALNYGLEYCKNELIARMDSDDISLLDRCEKQLEVFSKDDELSLVSGTLIEYDLEYTKVLGVKALPKTNKEIIKYSKSRNPINHPCVMMKKSAIINVGSYQDFYLHEDYYLWVRLLQNGYKAYNIEEPILHMRAGLEQIKRRGGYKYFKTAKSFQKYLLKSKYINIFTYVKNNTIRFFSQVILPHSVRQFFYRKFLRKSL